MAVSPFALRHIWPIWEQGQRFELGAILSSAVIDVCDQAAVGELGLSHAGCWECNLSDSSLTWSGGVNDLFGLPRGASISRQEALSFYVPESAALLDRVRTYAVTRNCGFSLDTQIRPAIGGTRRMRIIAAAAAENGVVQRLHGLKLLI